MLKKTSRATSVIKKRTCSQTYPETVPIEARTLDPRAAREGCMFVILAQKKENVYQEKPLRRIRENRMVGQTDLGL